MTAPDPKQHTVELKACVSRWPGTPGPHSHREGVCETHGYQRLRNAGCVFSSSQPDTQPLYRCYSDTEKSHFAVNNEDCGHLGKREALLGDDLNSEFSLPVARRSPPQSVKHWRGWMVHRRSQAHHGCPECT
jgi:hypothetical protein